MAYLCPRDREPLLWRDFLRRGRWFCRGCSGTFAFEKHLKGIAGFSGFFQSLRWVEAKNRLPCPVCHGEMERFAAGEAAKAVEIDCCERCRAFWFDPEEIRVFTKEVCPPGGPRESLQYSGYEEYRLRQDEWAFSIFSSFISFGSAAFFAAVALLNWRWLQALPAGERALKYCMGEDCASLDAPMYLCGLATVLFLLGRIVPLFWLGGALLGGIGLISWLALL